MFSIAEVSLADFCRNFRREAFDHPHIVLNKNRLCAEGNSSLKLKKNLILCEIKRSARFLGYGFLVRTSRLKIINHITSLKFPYLVGDLDPEEYNRCVRFYFESFSSARNVYFPWGVPDYMDDRLDPSAFQEFPFWETVIMDLSPGNVDELLASFPKNGRRDVRKAMRDENFSLKTLSKSSKKEVLLYKKLWQDVKGGNPWSDDEIFEIICEGEMRDNAATFLLFHEGLPVAASTVYYSEDLAREGGVIVSDYDRQNNLYAGYRLKIEICNWLMKKGVRSFDLMGMNPFPRTPKEEGIRAFKMKFGGRVVRYPIFSRYTGLGRVAKAAKDLRDRFGKKTT